MFYYSFKPLFSQSRGETNLFVGELIRMETMTPSSFQFLSILKTIDL